jgi:hypothetical protein
MLPFSLLCMALSIQEQVRVDAQKILASFGKTLGKVKLPRQKAPVVTENSGMRVEGKGSTTDEQFRKGMFQNAPKHDDAFLLVEKKEW